MKCYACGYEYEYHWGDYGENFDKIADKGDDSFIEIIGVFFARKDYENREEKGIVACPKCGTLKLIDK